MIRIRVAAIFASSLVQLMAYYLMVPYLLNSLQVRGVSSSMQGFVSSVGWAGVLAAMLTFRFFALRAGRYWLYVFATVLPAIAAVFITIFSDFTFLVVLSFLSGLGAGYRWSLSEGMLLEEFSSSEGTSSSSGKVIGWFEALSGVMSVIGPLIFYFTSDDLRLSGHFVVGLYCVGAFFSFFVAEPNDTNSALPEKSKVAYLERVPVSSFFVIMCFMSFCGGFYESGFMSVIPVLGASIGFSVEGSSLLMILCGFGSALAMIPLGYCLDSWLTSFSSRIDLIALLVLCVFLSCVVLYFYSGQAFVVWLVVFLLGAAGGGLYTVAIIFLGNESSSESLLLGTSTLVLFYTLGGMVSSGVSGYLIDSGHHGAYPLFMSVVALLALFSIGSFSWARWRSVVCR